MAQQGFGHFGGGGSVDPGDIMSGGYQSGGGYNNSNNFSSGFGDDELLDGLTPPDQQQGIHGTEFNGLEGGTPSSFSHGNVYSPHQGGMSIGQEGIYSNTPDGEPMHSPFAHGQNYPGNPLRQMQQNMQSPISGYSGSPLMANELAESRVQQMSQSMQRKPSNTRNPMPPKAGSMHGYPQPIQTSGLMGKSPSNQWMITPGGSMASFQSTFSSPMQHPHMPLNDVLKHGSMPAKLGVGPGTGTGPGVSQQEMKRKRRRESHNLVERRRRDNINERIQDLSKLVPDHRLEDEKIRKMIQNGTPLSPGAGGSTTPNQATSSLAGPGARRAAGAGNITTGLPMEEKDKAPNKGDILNGAVGWTRDLMWLCQRALQQNEALLNTLTEMGGQPPFEVTDDERRMQSELLEALSKNDAGADLTYSRTAGSGLRVPHHTDYKGEPLNGPNAHDGSSPVDINGLSELNDNQFWHEPDDAGSGDNSINFKEEDEYGMDLTQ